MDTLRDRRLSRDRRGQFDDRPRPGVATVTDPDCAKLDAMLLCVQNDLFDLGADLYMPELNAKPDPEALRVIQSQVDRLERKINELNADLAP